MAAITALTAQNTRGVSAVHVPPAAFLTAQLEAISQDITIDAVKIGMLGDASVIDAVRSWLEKARPGVVVLDPVMVATSGDRLLQEADEAALHALLPYADLITPNLAELAVLLGEPAAVDWSGALEQGKRLAARTGTTVLVKGGHLDGGGGTGNARPQRRLPRRAGQHRRAPGPGRRGGAGGAGAHPQQPRHGVLAVLGDRHGAGGMLQGAGDGGLGGRAPRGQALAAGGAAHVGRARRRHRQRPGPPLPPRPAAHPGPRQNRRRGTGRRRIRRRAPGRGRRRP